MYPWCKLSLDACIIATIDDCHQLLLLAITNLILDRAKTGLTIEIMKAKSHIGIHGNEMADRLANEAALAEECTNSRARQFDRDVSLEYCEPFKEMVWIQHKMQVPTTTPQRHWNLLGICTLACHRKCMRSKTWALQAKTQSTFSSCEKTCNQNSKPQ